MEKRLNGIIRTLETDGHVFAAFSSPEISDAIALSTSSYDAVLIDMEHQPWDPKGIRDFLQYLINRRRVFEADSLSPAVTPIVRIPANGSEFSQWQAKQVLDIGAYGVVWPHISTVEQARHAVAACRYPHCPGSERYEPKGIRGDGPYYAANHWGISVAEYYERAGVWPLDPNGEILVCIMIEDLLGVESLPSILDEVPGIGLVLLGPADLCQELGVAGQPQHPKVLELQRRVLQTCIEHGVAAAHPNVTAVNAKEVVNAGYRFLLTERQSVDPGQEAARQAIAAGDTGGSSKMRI